MRITPTFPLLSLLSMTIACNEPDPEASVDTFLDFDRFITTGLPYNAPDFNWIKQDNFKPAIEEGMKLQLAEVEAIVTNPEPATFANTVEALERTGRLLSRATSVMYSLVGAHTNEGLQKLRAELSPQLSAHSDAISMD
ncbi:MAG: hypothetical protein WEC15_04325 [Flavobacteriales bacterium]